MSVVASIPSPSSGVVHAGPFTIHMYGLTLLLGIALCVWLTGVRWTRRGGTWELVFRVAVWGVVAGIVGARLYHLATNWEDVPKTWWGPFAIWQGGLGLWGGIALGALVGALIVRRAGEDVALFANCVAPGLLLAQAVGRWGNWWNQELFGRPTGLPWALRISPEHLPPGFAPGTTFHPTFLYEFLWGIAMVGLLLYLDSRFAIRPPALFWLYVALYTGFHTWVEAIRVGPSKEILGMRVNFWVSLVVFVVSTALFVHVQFRRAPRGRPAGAVGSQP